MNKIIIALVLSMMLLSQPVGAANNITEIDVSGIPDLLLTTNRDETMFLLEEDKSIILVQQFFDSENGDKFQFVRVHPENGATNIGEPIDGVLSSNRIYKSVAGKILTSRAIEFAEGEGVVRDQIIEVDPVTGAMTVINDFSHINDFFLRSDTEFYIVGHEFTGQHETQDKIMLFNSTTNQLDTLYANEKNKGLFEFLPFNNKFLLVTSKAAGGENPEVIKLMKLKLKNGDQLVLKTVKKLFALKTANRAIFDLRSERTVGSNKGKNIYFFTVDPFSDKATLYKINSKNNNKKRIAKFENSSISLHNSQDLLFVSELIPQPDVATMLSFDKTDKFQAEVILPFGSNKIDILSGSDETLVIENLGPGQLELPDLNRDIYILNNEN